MEHFDFLVIGGGISGLTYALDTAEHGNVAVLFKKEIRESATRYAQGGIAAVSSPEDSFALHVEDTLTAGAGLSQRHAVELLVREGPREIERLIARGTSFDRQRNSTEYDLHKEGGHSKRRIYHSADSTGAEVQRALIDAAEAHPRITFFPHTSAIDLITTLKLGLSTPEKNAVLGVYALLPEGQTITLTAKKVLVSTGGAGKVYLYTSNPDVATGDGIAMCFRAGAPVANMEFFQFHPTCLFHPKAKSFLITEAMRGEGGKLHRLQGESFMHHYHERAELAPRDVVARAIDHEMKAHGEEHVFLDISHRGADFVKDHFPMIYEKCLGYGIDISKEPIPVVPAAHYCCGGVVSDLNGQTSIHNLYVAGECAHTGIHGANRLASNSLIEGLVFAARAAAHSIQTLQKPKHTAPIPDWDAGSATDSDEGVVIAQNWDEIRRFMWNYVGIVRTNKRLERALRRSDLIRQEINDYYWNFLLTPDLLELRNLSLVADLVIRSAMARRESRGLHYTLDYPEPLKEFEKDTLLYPQHANSP